MARRYAPDFALFSSTLVLLVVGLVMVFSASAVYAGELYGKPWIFLLKQLLWVGFGVAGVFVVLQVDYRRLRQPASIFTALFLVSSMLVGVLFMEVSRNTHRWLKLGSFSLQPSEFSKLVLILFLAYFLERQQKVINDFRRTLLPAGLITGVLFVLVVIEPDLGTAALLALIAVAMFYVAGLHLRYLFFAGVVSVPVLAFLIALKPYRLERVKAFLDPTSDPQGTGFQAIQSILAVGSGGVTGAGLMQGQQKLFYLPEAHTDFIYAVVGEELGLWGALLVVVLFGIIAWRGLRISSRAPDLFSRLLAVGVTTMIVGQALINMSVVLALLPTKGIPLPFISYGGSDVLVMLLGMGLLLNISQHAD